MRGRGSSEIPGFLPPLGATTLAKDQGIPHGENDQLESKAL